MRRNSDEEIRRLERRAAHGDVGAIRKLRQIRRRLLPPRSSKFRKFATWDEVGDAVWPKGRRGHRDTEFARTDDLPPSWILDGSWEYAAEWAKEFEKEREVDLTDEQKSAVDTQFMWALERHWTAEALLKNRLEKLVFGPIDEWAKKPLSESAVEDWDRHYWHEPKVGTAIEWGEAEDSQKGSGIWFKVYRPFLRVLQDVRRDDRQLSTVDIEDVMSLAREIWELEHGGFSRHVFAEPPHGYEDWWDPPNDGDIEAAIIEAGPLIPRPESEEEPEEDLS